MVQLKNVHNSLRECIALSSISSNIELVVQNLFLKLIHVQSLNDNNLCDTISSSDKEIVMTCLSTASSHWRSFSIKYSGTFEKYVLLILSAYSNLDADDLDTEDIKFINSIMESLLITGDDLLIGRIFDSIQLFKVNYDDYFSISLFLNSNKGTHDGARD